MVTSKNKSLWYLCAFSFALTLFLLLTSVASAQETDEAMEREAQAIDKMIMCPVCPAETIDQAQVEISFQMRAVVRELLAEGRSRDEVLDYFVDRYGADILAAPPKSGSNLVAWILPIVGVAAGLVGVFFVIRSMTGSQRRNGTPVTALATPAGGPQTSADPENPELLPFLEIADRILASRRATSRPAGPPTVVAEASNPPDFPVDQNETPSKGDDTNG